MSQCPNEPILPYIGSLVHWFIGSLIHLSFARFRAIMRPAKLPNKEQL
jgi:hypothetical protein